MTIQVSWGDPSQTWLNLRFERGWTWADLKQALAEIDTMLDSVNHTVHLIIDIREAGALPGDFLSAANELFAQGEARANEGLRIVIGAGPLIRAAYQGLMAIYSGQLANRPFVFASSLEDAQRIMDALKT